VLLLVVACSSAAEPLCQVPAQTTYSCQPLTGSAGSDDCVGGPTWTALHATTDAPHQDDPDKVFPVRCTADIPDCSPYYMGSPREFLCTYGGWHEQL
jgi:hypothetical protein